VRLPGFAAGLSQPALICRLVAYGERGFVIPALVLCDDPWHQGGLVREGLQEGLQRVDDGILSFDWMLDPGDWSSQRIASCRLVILAKANNVSAEGEPGWMTERIEAAFVDHVARGNGLLAVHSGTAGYSRMKRLRALLGGVFVSHPELCPVTVEPRGGHPLAAGSAAFTVEDEHYFMEMDDPDVDVFVTTRSRHGEQPGGWTRREGSGRVAVLTPGHNVEVWRHPSFQKLLLNAMLWCGGKLELE
jgi:type 1 glutamine amidotransferase